MALHLNLYHEVQKQKALSRRDPLKLSIYGLAAIAVGMAGYYFLQLGHQGSVASEHQRVKAEYDQLAPKADAAQKRADEIAVTLDQAKKLVSRIEDRLHWAPILETLVTAVPAEVQVTRLAGDISRDETKRCSLSIDGIAAGAEPRQVAEDFRQAVARRFGSSFSTATSTFRALEDGAETVRLNGQMVRTATFSIVVQLQGASDKSAALQAGQPAVAKGGA